LEGVLEVPSGEGMKERKMKIEERLNRRASHSYFDLSLVIYIGIRGSKYITVGGAFALSKNCKEVIDHYDFVCD
jgi:hypothetical protein